MEFGGTCDPRDAGLDPDRLGEAVELIGARGAVAQLCVVRHGQTVVDRSFECSPNALFWLFSASKPYLAVVIHQLVESGRLHLDDAVAAYWPEFAHNGKREITVRHVLRHRSGVSSAGSYVGELRAMTDWDRSLRRIEDTRPRWPIGTVAYSPLAFGFILGEVARRCAGLPFDELVRRSVFEPLGTEDTYLGLPDDLWGRHVPIRAVGPVGPFIQSVLNNRRTREAVVPAAGISTTAREVAWFYQALLDGRLLRPESLAVAVEPTSEGEYDPVARAPVRWSQGFQLGGPRWMEGTVSSLGSLSSPRAFGHNGSNCCVGWADPDRQIAYAYLTNRVGRPKSDLAHHAAVADKVLEAAG
ncbi:serine hydrolase domain-containing protein [Kribbella shirazensis]|uniref:CubicO group peptidase (Beta-lactamase class C family) n=1 Tax=Kribbella shirazensis TaxID=1105143 RepID=A0A7X5VJE9_9ACTN|nr:serine hydrolase domain-containing protein [Kribbella shirazensis]NIK62385.1 CubicO group peptidase (beta-lactamase class C family) [Kribbella shirazensis]